MLPNKGYRLHRRKSKLVKRAAQVCPVGSEFSSSDKARRLGVDPSRCRAYEVSLNAWFSLGAALAVHVYACTLMRARQTSLGSAWPFSCGTMGLNLVVQLESCSGSSWSNPSVSWHHLAMRGIVKRSKSPCGRPFDELSRWTSLNASCAVWAVRTCH